MVCLRNISVDTLHTGDTEDDDDDDNNKPVVNILLCSMILAPQVFKSTVTLLTHCGRVTQICVFTLQLCRTGHADLRF